MHVLVSTPVQQPSIIIHMHGQIKGIDHFQVPPHLHAGSLPGTQLGIIKLHAGVLLRTNKFQFLSLVCKPNVQSNYGMLGNNFKKFLMCTRACCCTNIILPSYVKQLQNMRLLIAAACMSMLPLIEKRCRDKRGFVHSFTFTFTPSLSQIEVTDRSVRLIFD